MSESVIKISYKRPFTQAFTEKPALMELRIEPEEKKIKLNVVGDDPVNDHIQSEVITNIEWRLLPAGAYEKTMSKTAYTELQCILASEASVFMGDDSDWQQEVEDAICQVLKLERASMKFRWRGGCKAAETFPKID